MTKPRNDWDAIEAGYYEDYDDYDPVLEARESELELLVEELTSYETWVYYMGKDIEDLRLEDYVLEDKYNRRKRTRF